MTWFHCLVLVSHTTSLHLLNSLYLPMEFLASMYEECLLGFYLTTTLTSQNWSAYLTRMYTYGSNALYVLFLFNDVYQPFSSKQSILQLCIYKWLYQNFHLSHASILWTQCTTKYIFICIHSSYLLISSWSMWLFIWWFIILQILLLFPWSGIEGFIILMWPIYRQ